MKRKGMMATVLLLTCAAPAVAQVPIKQLRECRQIEDMTKERLDCYDAIVPSQPKAAARPKSILECRFLQEEDERLLCFNRFLEPRPAAKPALRRSDNPPSAR